jgi:hypothetical protein
LIKSRAYCGKLSCIVVGMADPDHPGQALAAAETGPLPAGRWVSYAR